MTIHLNFRMMTQPKGPEAPKPYARLSLTTARKYYFTTNEKSRSNQRLRSQIQHLEMLRNAGLTHLKNHNPKIKERQKKLESLNNEKTRLMAEIDHLDHLVENLESPSEVRSVKCEDGHDHSFKFSYDDTTERT